MDVSIITTVIATMGGIALGVGGAISSERIKRKNEICEVRKLQLKNVFIPIYSTLVEDRSLTQEVNRVAILDILKKHFELIPEILRTEISKISVDHKPYDTDKLHQVTKSYYNWLCRHLGYPYTESSIDKRFTPEHQKNLAREIRITVVFTIVAMGITLLPNFLSEVTVYDVTKSFVYCLIFLVTGVVYLRFITEVT